MENRKDEPTTDNAQADNTANSKAPSKWRLPESWRRWLNKHQPLALSLVGGIVIFAFVVVYLALAGPTKPKAGTVTATPSAMTTEEAQQEQARQERAAALIVETYELYYYLETLGFNTYTVSIVPDSVVVDSDLTSARVTLMIRTPGNNNPPQQVYMVRKINGQWHMVCPQSKRGVVPWEYVMTDGRQVGTFVLTMGGCPSGYDVIVATTPAARQ